MPFEIDMLNVGNADAIILRHIDNDGLEFVVLIDAGETAEHGQMVIDHINTYTEQKYIDLAINTHPDIDHIGGFFRIFERQMRIDKFWIHDPKMHKKINEDVIGDYLANEITMEKGLKYVVESLNQSIDLITLIDSAGIDREEPFEGLESPFMPLKVLGPSENYYNEKLQSFRDIHLLYESVALEKSETNLESLEMRRKKFNKYVDRSNENNSSVILLFSGDDQKVLFTSDAGPQALKPLIDKYDLKNIRFLDVPHHGSKYNLDTEIMDKLNPRTAFISCADKYPDQFIVEYLKKGGTRVFSTKTHGNIRHRHNCEPRPGWTSITPL